MPTLVTLKGNKRLSSRNVVVKKTRTRPRYKINKMYQKYKKTRLVRLIKSTIYRNAEHKNQYKEVTLSPYILSAGISTINGNYFMLTPQGATVNVTNGIGIAKGTSQITRVGNRIRTYKAILSYTINPKNYNATTNPTPCPMTVRMYFFRSKTNPLGILDVNALTSVTTSTFFENGSSYSPFTGYLMDYNRKMSSDNYTYLGMRQHKVGYNYFTNTGGNNAFGQSSNNDYKLSVLGKIDCTKMLAKTIEYDDSDNVLTPYVWCVIQVVRADNNQLSAPSNTEQPITVQLSYNYSYTDV